MRLDLADGIHRHVDHDQQTRPAEEQGDTRLRDHVLGKHTHQGEIDRTDDRDTREYVVEVVLGALAGANSRDEAPVLLEVLRRFLGVEDHRGVEEREEDDPGRI